MMIKSFRQEFTELRSGHPGQLILKNILALDPRPDMLAEISQDSAAAAILLIGDEGGWPEMINLGGLSSVGALSSAHFTLDEPRGRRPQVILLPPCPVSCLHQDEIGALARAALNRGSVIIAPVLCSEATCEEARDFGAVALYSGHNTNFLTRPGPKNAPPPRGRVGKLFTNLLEVGRAKVRA